MDPNKSNISDMDVRSPLREINLQNNTNSEQNNSPNKSVNLLDATTTSFENSILMPATDPGNTLDVTTTNQENQRPRFSLLGTFDPIYQKSDNGKSDSADVDFASLIDDPKQPLSELIDERSLNIPFDEKKLFVPENELNKSNVSNVSSVSDVSELNNTVVLSKTLAKNKEDNSESVSVTPIKFVPKLKENIGGSDLSDSFLEKFTKATVISTPTSLKNPTENVLESTFSKEEQTEKIFDEFDIQDTDSIELENPISQSEDFDTDSLNEEIESAQSEILHELSVESSKIVSELNKTQEILKEAISSDTEETLVVETKDKSFELIEKEKLQSVTFEQKEQIIQEINVTYSEPISPNKSERQEECETGSVDEGINLSNIGIVSPNKSVNFKQAEALESPRKDTSLEIFVKEEIHQQQLAAEEISREIKLIPEESSEPISPNKTQLLEEVPTEVLDKNTPVKSIEQNISFEISTPSNKTAPEVNPEEINKNISFVFEASPPFPKLQLGSPQKLSEIIKNKEEISDIVSPIVKLEDTAVNKNISFVIEAAPESPQKLSETINKEEIPDFASSPIVKTVDPAENKNISFVINSNPVTPQKLSETITKEAISVISSPSAISVVDSAVDKNNISLDTESSLDIKSIETSQKLNESIKNTEEVSDTTSTLNPVDSVVNKNISFVIEATSASPQKLSEIAQNIEQVPVITSTPTIKTEDSAGNKNISFVIEPTPESPQKLNRSLNIKEEVFDIAVDSAVNKNISFVIEATPASPRNLSEIAQNIEQVPVITSTPTIKTEDSAENKNISFVIEPTPESPQKLNKSSNIKEEIFDSAVNKNTSFAIESKLASPQKLIEVKPETPKKIVEEIKSEELGVKSLQKLSDEIVKTPQKVEDISATPIVEPVIISEPSDIHMSEAKPVEKSEVSESAVTNSAPTNEMGEVINQKECFQKQSDITNGAVDNKETLDPKNEMYNEMVERLSLLESECEKYKIQVADLKREIKTCRQKSASLESEVADLKRKENELNILLDEYKNKKPESTDSDGKDEELKLLRASEETLKNEVIELKVLVKQHENKLKELQQKEVKLADDLSSKTQSELQISRVMEEYEKSISSLVAENEKMKKERDTAQMHLSNIELAFSDVHQKYERCKRVVQGYKDNEESYRQDIAVNRETIATQEQKYATLKAHAMAQLEKSNQELLGMKKQHETEMARLTAQLKRYEIKNDSLMEALQQKTKECEQLSAVCDEFIGNV